MTPNPFHKATRSAARLRLALIGPAGSGKTWTALAVAAGLGGKVALVDTERGSASKYAGDFDFDSLELDSFHPLRYVEAIQAAEANGYAVLILDSLSHAWVGKDGGLELHDAAVARQRTKNTYTAWAEVTPHHNALVQAVTQSKCHVIATMRAKTEYVQEKDERTGRTAVRKVGLAPVQRDGLEYEFDLVGDMDADNTLVVSKTRCPALRGAVVRLPGAPLAATLREWLGSGAPVTPPAQPPAPLPPPGRPAPRPGENLLARLKAHEAELAAEGRCGPGELLAHVRIAGTKAGLSANIKEWSGAAIRLGVDEVLAFDAAHPPKGPAPDLAALREAAEEAGYADEDALAGLVKQLTGGELATLSAAGVRAVVAALREEVAEQRRMREEEAAAIAAEGPG